ncbi:MAG: iron-sulfur cluster assembly accessory protein [Pseudomonadota bacterium]
MDFALPVRVSQRAFERLAEIAEAQGEAVALRVAVLGGGCSGFSYEFALAEAPEANDLVIEGQGQRVFVDPESLPFLEGAVVDFKDELIGARFEIDNPNATSTCGCGTSFSI